MKFSELLKIKNANPQISFVLGMIYARPVVSKEIVIAYSSYRKGSRSENKLSKGMEEYYDMHKDKLEKFLGSNYEIVLNKNIDKTKLENGNERPGEGVSVLIENDLTIPNDVNNKTYIYGLIEKWLIDVDEECKKLFLVGALDARGSLDFTMKYIAMDIIEETPILVKRKLSKYNDIIGAVFNYNPRLIQEKAFTKNDQFRLPMFYYMGNFGLFTPFKIDYYKSEIENYIEIINSGFFFLDGQYKNIKIPETYTSERNLKINNLAIKLQEKSLSFDEKREIIENWKNENYSSETDDEILFSSQNMKEFSKKNGNYLCEYDNKHITFNAKSNNKNYVEAHHLVPFSERNRFDVSIDVTENIVCLCPNCHKKIHLAVDTERKDFIKNLFENRKDSLEKLGIKFDLKVLFKYYKLNIDEK